MKKAAIQTANSGRGGIPPAVMVVPDLAGCHGEMHHCGDANLFEILRCALSL